MAHRDRAAHGRGDQRQHHGLLHAARHRRGNLQGVTLPGFTSGTPYYIGFGAGTGSNGLAARQEIRNVAVTFGTEHCLDRHAAPGRQTFSPGPSASLNHFASVFMSIPSRSAVRVRCPPSCSSAQAA